LLRLAILCGCAGESIGSPCCFSPCCDACSSLSVFSSVCFGHHRLYKPRSEAEIAGLWKLLCAAATASWFAAYLGINVASRCASWLIGTATVSNLLTERNQLLLLRNAVFLSAGAGVFSFGLVCSWDRSVPCEGRNNCGGQFPLPCSNL